MMAVIANFSIIINLEDTSLMSTALPGQSHTNVLLRDATNHLRLTEKRVNMLKYKKVIKTSGTQCSLTELPIVDNRYACANTTCSNTRASGSLSPLYFPNWTALQARARSSSYGRPPRTTTQTRVRTRGPPTLPHVRATHASPRSTRAFHPHRTAGGCTERPSTTRTDDGGCVAGCVPSARTASAHACCT